LNYIVASFFGSIPGCVGTFAMDSLYMAGLLSLGGIVSTMIATAGDETFLMFAMGISGKINLWLVFGLILILFILGIFIGFLVDLFDKKHKIKLSKKCCIEKHEKEKFNFKHFLKIHIKDHILKKHIWQIFIWIFLAIFFIELSGNFINLENLFNNSNYFILLLFASLIAIFPISGPNVFLLVLFSKNLIPFSILLANSIIQDGHGLLPLLGFSFRDAVKIKLINFIFGLVIGFVLLLIGI
jgi:hypothetical protein